MFVAADPGRLRLRTSARAVLGVGLAVTVSHLAAGTLGAAVAGGLAALLALFTVTGPTVREQALTTALLPVVGFPVLALATALHGTPWARDTAFLVVVFAGVYARRWGPRGQALGIFAFMTFFMTQFLHAVPAELPALYTAMTAALAASSLVRFGLWCIERRTPPPAVPAPPTARGLARPTTRQAFQNTFACALALGIGQFVSDERWYWAVGTAWWIFVNTASRGETLVRGFRRVVGTLAGIAVGLLVAIPLHGAAAPTLVLVALCVFGIFYTAAPSYSWMMFFVTVMAGLLYGLLGVLHPGLLALRLEQTLVGAGCSALALTLVLPVTTHEATDAWIRRALLAVRRCTAESARRLGGEESADPAPYVAELELLLGRVRASLAPLLHPLSPLRARKERARQIMVHLDDCARQARGLAAVAADPDASHDARLTAACQRVETALRALLPAAEAPLTTPEPGSAAPQHHPGAERALDHLHDLEKALAALTAPLLQGPRPPLAGA
ncbi:FUSC family protein [Streptomyces sp. MST-110588]|uniref:FUSC family protein n=1 Tax=Streptomyces sp. MST-110588 TaxID=2833628 RepID=UPI001F5E0916|nr:FUSC family protein [Streptomyces sp. MST-110588]UNO43310.1 FUSC family protein [Streptomyces sp. MST-110588]